MEAASPGKNRRVSSKDQENEGHFSVRQSKARWAQSMEKGVRGFQTLLSTNGHSMCPPADSRSPAWWLRSTSPWRAASPPLSHRTPPHSQLAVGRSTSASRSLHGEQAGKQEEQDMPRELHCLPLEIFNCAFKIDRYWNHEINDTWGPRTCPQSWTSSCTPGQSILSLPTRGSWRCCTGHSPRSHTNRPGPRLIPKGEPRDTRAVPPESRRTPWEALPPCKAKPPVLPMGGTETPLQLWDRTSLILTNSVLLPRKTQNKVQFHKPCSKLMPATMGKNNVW